MRNVKIYIDGNTENESIETPQRWKRKLERKKKKNSKSMLKIQCYPSIKPIKTRNFLFFFHFSHFEMLKANAKKKRSEWYNSQCTVYKKYQSLKETHQNRCRKYKLYEYNIDCDCNCVALPNEFETCARRPKNVSLFPFSSLFFLDFSENGYSL